MAGISRPPATLLFCHGGGFCKDVWTPIISRLQQTRLLQQSTFVTFDLPYHGEHRDVSQHATINRENPKSVRVSHPAMNWTEWATAGVQRQVRELPPKQGAPLIGIGHSMGAAALWATEVATPGTFDALVLFEPIVNGDTNPTMISSIDFLVALTLKRTGQWESFEDAEQEIMGSRNFARWDRDTLRHYVNGAVVKVRPENNVLDPEANYALSCHPLIEASLYGGGTLQLTDEEMLRVKCPITFQYGERTQLFYPKAMQWLADEHPQTYTIAEPVAKTSHTLVMEDPAACTSRIMDALVKLPLFASVVGSKL